MGDEAAPQACPSQGQTWEGKEEAFITRPRKTSTFEHKVNPSLR